jgi:hypothetical protein
MAKQFLQESVETFIQLVVESMHEYGMSFEQITEVFDIIQYRCDTYHDRDEAMANHPSSMNL